jgi:hypothetical protein
MDQVQQLLLKLPPHYRADVQMRLDQASVYRSVLRGWASYRLGGMPRKLTIHLLANHLLAMGEPQVGGYLLARHPGSRSDISNLLGVGESAAYDAIKWLATCPLIRPSLELDGYLRIFGSENEQPSQGDAQGRFSYAENGAPAAPAVGVSLSESAAPPALEAPPDRRSAAVPARPSAAPPAHPAPPERRSGAVPALEAPPERRSGAVPALLSIAASSSREELTAAASESHSAQKPPKFAWLPDPNLDEPDPAVLTLLADHDVFGEPLQVLPRCSELTVTLAREVLDVCRQQGKGAGVWIKRLADRVRVRRRKQSTHPAPPRPSGDEDAVKPRIDDALAGLSPAEYARLAEQARASLSPLQVRIAERGGGVGDESPLIREMVAKQMEASNHA